MCSTHMRTLLPQTSQALMHTYQHSPSPQQLYSPFPLDTVFSDPLPPATDSPIPSVFSVIGESEEGASIAYDVKGRNSKRPKKANHGARPCSSVMRKLKKRN